MAYTYIGVGVILRHVRNGIELPPIEQNTHYDFDYQLTNHVTPRVVLPVSDAVYGSIPCYVCVCILVVVIIIKVFILVRKAML